jgi:ribonuclease BN (tRNA processing enzyme)
VAREASLLIHDCQYTEEEYRRQRGWGHSSLPDALTFAGRCRPRHLVLFHHDPGHEDPQLEEMGEEAADRWERLGGGGPVELAREGLEIDCSLSA